MYLLVTSNKLCRVKEYHEDYIKTLRRLDEIVKASRAYGEVSNKDIEESLFVTYIDNETYIDPRGLFGCQRNYLTRPEFYKDKEAPCEKKETTSV